MISDDRNDANRHGPEEDDYLTPPRLAHTMAVVRWVLLGVLSIFALGMILSYAGLAPWANADTGGVQYHCPMHPTYVSSQPGDCPICGMTLVPIEQDGTAPAAEEVAAPAQEHQDSTTTAAKPGQYTCPMHPEVVSDEPGRCPKCGMYLEQVPEPAAPDTSGIVREPEQVPPPLSDVPGLVPITLATERVQLIGLKTGKVERRALGGRLRLVGFVTPDETRMANLHVRVNGWVSKLFVDQMGQLVRQGQPLLSLYSQDIYQAEQDLLVARDGARKPDSDSLLADLRNRLLSAARERLRLLGLSDAEIAAVESSDLPSQEMMLRSPFSGYVLEKSVLEGQYVSPSSNLFTIADLSRVWVLVDVYERDFPSVTVGQKVQMRLTAFPGEVFKGEIGFIYPSVSEQTRTLKVRLEFANRDLKLRPGMYAEIEADRDRGPVLAVPAAAVMDGGETQYAFVVREGTHFEPRLLVLGQRSDDWVEVKSGLAEGETVVTSANFLIDSESRLKAAIAGMDAPAASSAGAHQH
jgi:Cu(I)/Ag(I) efflux system membrane fusion protein